MAVKWGATNFLRIWLESTYGVDPTGGGSPVEGTDFIWIRLDQNNAFSMRPMPQFYEIRAGDGGNRRVQTGSSFLGFAGALNTLFYPTQAAFLMKAAATLTGAPNNLPSYTIDHYDGNRTRRYMGCMCKQLRISETAEQQYARLAYQFIAQKNLAADPTVSAPTSANFPDAVSVPYVHFDSKGLVKINNVIRVNYSTLDVTIDNKLGSVRAEDQYITALFYAGRDVDWTLKSTYEATTDRNAFETSTKLITSQIKWLKGANSVTMDLKSTNYFKSCDDDLPLDNAEFQTLSVATYYDATASTDMTITVV